MHEKYGKLKTHILIQVYMQLISVMIHVFKNMKNYDENVKMLLELTY